MARAYPRPKGRGITALAIDRQVSGIENCRTKVQGIQPRQFSIRQRLRLQVT